MINKSKSSFLTPEQYWEALSKSGETPMANVDNINGAHACPAKPEMWKFIPQDSTSCNFGHAVDNIVRNPEGWWASSGSEYSTKIFFCPFCGEKLP